MPKHPVMGIFASKKARSGPNNPLERFLQKYYMSKLTKFDLVVTGGTYDDVFANRSLAPHQHTVTRLNDGVNGGVVQIANKVVTDECKVVLFFSDPEDLKLDSSINRPIIRICHVKNAKLLLNYSTAALWAEKEAKQDAKSPLKITQPANWVPGNQNPTKIEEETLALIAHDAKKKHMWLFCYKNQNKLVKFHRILATGHTGSEIERIVQPLSGRIIKFESGPDGGDIRIANEILEHKCHHVIFFVDPLTSHPHYEDIRMLLRVSQLPGVNVNLRTNLESAQAWIDQIP